MIKTIIDADDSFMIEKKAGKNIYGDKVPQLDVSVSEMHSVNIRDRNEEHTSHMLVCLLRLDDGTLRPSADPEPEFHKDAHYLVRIIGPSMRDDKYHQFDRDGNYLG